MPLGGKLAEMLAIEAGMTYAGESLATVFEAVEPRIGSNRLWEMLEALYSVQDADEWYTTVASIVWRRVYTTNIDNLFQYLARYPSGQRVKTVVRGQPPRERDQLFEELQIVHLHGWVENRSTRLTFTPGDFAAHTARIDPWYQALVDDINNTPCLFLGTQLEEPMLNHYLELREPRERSREVKEVRPRSFFVNRIVGDIKKAALATRNIFAIEASGEEFFVSLAEHIALADLSLNSVRQTEYPHLYSQGRNVPNAVSGHFDQIVPGMLPGARPGTQSRFFLGTEPTWDDIDKRRDGDREITQDLITATKTHDEAFALIALLGPAGSGKTTTLMRAAFELAASGETVFFARGTSRIDWDGVLRLVDDQANKGGVRTYVFVDVVSRHVESIVSVNDELRQAKGLTLVVADRTNVYARKCKRLDTLDPNILRMPDLALADIRSILDRLENWGFLGVLKNKTREEQEDAFTRVAKNQLLVAMKEATSGKEFDVILRDEFSELAPEAQLAYVICSIAVHHGAPGVYRRHLMPCIPRSSFAKAVVLDELLRGVLVAPDRAGTLLTPRHRLIATWIATEVAPVEMRYEATVGFLRQVSGDIVPNEIKRRSAPYLAYRGMVNSSGLLEVFNGNTVRVLELYEEVRPLYSNDFLFWLQYGMAHIHARNFDIAENFLTQSRNIRPNSYQTLHQLGVLYLMQAQTSEHPAAMMKTAEDGMELLREHMLKRGDHDSYGHHAYLTHVTRWYEAAGDLITTEEWEALRKVASEARKHYALDDNIREAADEVEHAYLRRLVVRPKGSRTIGRSGDAAGALP